MHPYQILFGINIPNLLKLLNILNHSGMKSAMQN